MNGRRSIRPPKLPGTQTVPTRTVDMADAALALLEREVARLFRVEPPDGKIRLRPTKELYTALLSAMQSYTKQPSRATYEVPLEIVPGEGNVLFEISFLPREHIEVLRLRKKNR